MLRENQTKAKLRRGEPVFGVIGGAADPGLVEMIGLAGYDFYMLDGEHGAVGPADAAHVARACEAAGITPLARVGSRDAKLVLQYLDAGMAGIMMPGLQNAAEVSELVAAVKYPPLGRRGLGQGRANDYMIGPQPQPDYVAFANDQTLVLPQFEEAGLLAALPDMVRVAGVDGIVVGPRDLSLTMGYPDGPAHAEVQTVIERVFQIVRRAGLAAGITAGAAEAAQAELARGATFILDSAPVLIERGAAAFLKPLRQM